MSQPRPDTVLAVDEALEQLAAHNPDAARVAEMRLFSGLSFEEVAQSLGMSSSTCHRLWLYARASLHAAITEAP
jgi:DNA-directed RNA polymerase specialized sigma24 family protein